MRYKLQTLCHGPTARFLKNRELRRNSGSRDRNNYSKMSSDLVVTLYTARYSANRLQKVGRLEKIGQWDHGISC